MNASIVLDQGGNVSYTNLDEISGRVVVRVSKPADVNSVVVKLEGESRTRLLAPPGDDGKGAKPSLEYHKILYKVQTVFPPAQVAEQVGEGMRPGTGKLASYTLPPGQHEYPFMFKIPFNNSCSFLQGGTPKFDLAGLSIEVARAPTKHVKKTLPPTLTGFPGEAEIRYFVKATVNRSSWLKENSRTYVPFNFLPIEPPRLPFTGSEIYARQKHAFTLIDGQGATSKMKGIFSKKAGEAAAASGKAPFVSVDARLPEPPILTCCDDLPLRIVVKKLNEHHDAIYLQTLQVSLVGVTKVRAHETFRDETNSWIVVSKSNMGVQIGTPQDLIDSETILDDKLWRGLPLPNTVAPSFDTCNISRTYVLDVRVGLSYDASGMSMSGKAQNITLPLRLNCEIYSGIRPPVEVLERMAAARESVRRTSMPEKTAAESSRPPYMPARPPGGTSPQAASEAPPPEYSEAPPSYEDAVAQELPPIDGPRREYAPPVPIGEDPLLGRDEKRGWVS